MFTFVYSCGHEHQYSDGEKTLNMDKISMCSSHVGETYANVMMRCYTCANKYTDEQGMNTNSMIVPVMITNEEKARLELEMEAIGMSWVKFLS